MTSLLELGAVQVFIINTSNIDQSVEFYNALGFKETMRADWPFKWVMVTDGAVQIMLRLGDIPYASVTYFLANAESFIHQVEEKGIIFSSKPDYNAPILKYTLQSPEGVNISYVTAIEGFSRPALPTMLHFPQSDFFNAEKYPNAVLGLFGEYAVPVTDLEASKTYWGYLGYNVVSSFASPYPWAILTDGLTIIGLHQTQKFPQPTLTFFACDMKNKIQALKDAGIAGFLNDDASSTTLATPEQQHFNLYKLGM